MTVLPVVERELRVASRRWQTYWGRAVGALAATVIAGYSLLLTAAARGGVQSADSGATMFWVLSGFACLFSVLAGVTYTADSVSSERREGTLGLLFLTDLGGVDVALGKLAANSLGAFYGLLAVLPVMGITILLGGVTAGEYARVTLLLVVCLASTLSLGLFASTCAGGSRNAGMLAFLFAVLLVAFFPLLGPSLDWALERAHWQVENTDVWSRRLSSISPFGALQLSMDAGYKLKPGGYWATIGVTAAAGIAAILASSWRLPRVWQDKPLQPSKAPPGSWKNLFRYTGDRRTRLLDRSPVAWLSVRHLARRGFPWLILSGGAIIFASIAWHDETIVRDAWWFFFITGLIQFALKFWLASDASRQLLEDRRSGAIELQMVSPLSTTELIRGHLLAVWRLALYPIITLLVGDVILLSYAAGSAGFSGDDRDSRQFFTMWLVREIIFVADLFALAWVSLHAGMVSPSARAPRGVITKVLLLPWLISAAVLPVAFYMFTQSPRWAERFDGVMATLAWALLCLGNDAFWALYARRRLMNQFRERATRPLAAAGGLSPLRLFRRA
jgi:ABC-type transport system involved in cytochrome c biogenesis permease component